jgi:hypothetical protein
MYTAKRFIGIHCKRTVCVYTLGTFGFALYLALLEFIQLFVFCCHKKVLKKKESTCEKFRGTDDTDDTRIFYPNQRKIR